MVGDLAPFEATRVLGQGGTGEVFLAHGPRGQVALKVLSDETARNLRWRDQLLDAAQKLARVQHSAIARVVAAGTLADGRPYIASEYVEGQTLGDLLALEGALDYERVLSLGAKLAGGLAAAHRVGLVHGDLKPTNIMVAAGRREVIKLLDFQGAQAKGTASPLGHPEYWSPEQACGGATDARSDIYALGVILYEALTGATPFRSHSYSDLVELQLHAEPSRLVAPAKVRPIPAGVQDVVLRCLRKNAGERFASAAELARALAGAATTGRVKSRRRRLVLASAAATACMLLGAATATYFISRDGVSAPRGTAEPDEVAVAVESKPEGAFVYRAVGGNLLGTTPGTFRLARGRDAVYLLVRFPDGARTQLRVVPTEPARFYVEPPQPATAE